MKWISVKEDLPKSPKPVLIFIPPKTLHEAGVFKIASYIPKEYMIGGDSYVTNNPKWDIPSQWREPSHWVAIEPPN